MTEVDPSAASTYSPSSWSPNLYGAQYTEERTRPAVELIQRTQHAASTATSRGMHRLYDLGTGTGRHIPRLLEAFPEAASLVGTDTSEPMLEAAKELVRSELERSGRAHWHSKVSLRCEDIEHFVAQPAADLLFSNSVLHWLPDHTALFERFMSQLSPGGILAVALPYDRNKPQHTLMMDVAQRMEQQSALPAGTTARVMGSAPDTGCSTPHAYFDLLRPHCSYLDVWSTTYYHNMTAPVSAGHPIAHFCMGSTLAQAVNGLPEASRAAYVAEYVRRLTEAYPVWSTGEGEMGTCYPLERWFIVAVKKMWSDKTPAHVWRLCGGAAEKSANSD